ncbi:gastrula zinc finger protein XlCGF26.1-like [Pecten maximus]|uniref:gastrula zinc finger protein XlCGF26.1-like n=1 Tax=Pecten maximus TaxID=6579 RepID=UPI001458E5E4|nr:gastrula zinc finger protein XlCGF26.1-like [Pecten maximus]XP_033745350.1 gastrula zinc finger protein XlCGF26.1-like [Pecten maximus]
MEQISLTNHNPVLPTNQDGAFLAVQNAVLPNSPDFEMETICPDLEHEIDPTLLDDIDLYLECDDDDVNFTAPISKDYKNVTFKVSFYPGSENNEANSRKKFVCQICKEDFKMETKFKVHMAECHSDKKPFMCNICSYRAASMKLLKQHFVKVHKTENSSNADFESLTNVNGPKIKFICSKCPYSTTRKDKLVKHFNKNHRQAEKSFSCDQCNFVCKQKKTFSLHVKKHEGTSLELICEICGKDFLTNTQFNRHYKTHKEERPFKCSIPGCEMTFKIKGASTDHMKSVHRFEKQNLKFVDQTIVPSDSGLSDQQNPIIT